MKRFATLVLAALAWSSPAALAIHTPAENPFSSRIEENASLIDACVAAFNELISTYESIVDTASAQTAVEKLPALHTGLQNAVDKVNSIGEADEATQNLMMTRLMPMMFVFGARTTAAFERIKENDYYGCDELRSFMEQVLPQA